MEIVTHPDEPSVFPGFYLYPAKVTCKISELKRVKDEFIEVIDLHIEIDEDDSPYVGVLSAPQFFIMQVWNALNLWDCTPEITIAVEGKNYNVLNELAKLLIQAEDTFGKRPTVKIDDDKNALVNANGKVVVNHVSAFRRKLEDRVSQMKNANPTVTATTRIILPHSQPQP